MIVVWLPVLKGLGWWMNAAGAVTWLVLMFSSVSVVLLLAGTITTGGASELHARWTQEMWKEVEYEWSAQYCAKRYSSILKVFWAELLRRRTRIPCELSALATIQYWQWFSSCIQPLIIQITDVLSSQGDFLDQGMSCECNLCDAFKEPFQTHQRRTLNYYPSIAWGEHACPLDLKKDGVKAEK